MKLESRIQMEFLRGEALSESTENINWKLYSMEIPWGLKISMRDGHWICVAMTERRESWQNP
jgi:hypothetical protein